MYDRTRYKFGLIAFFTFCALAVAKHFLPGMSEVLIISASVPVVSYILSEGKYPSVPRGGNGESK